MEIKSQLFRKIEKEALASLTALFKREEIPEGTLLRREGERAKSAFFLLEGEIGVLKRSGDGEELEVAVIEGGEDIFFSLTSLLDGGKSLTTLRAKKSCTIAEISQSDFFGFCRKDSKAGVVLLTNTLTLMAHFLRLGDDKIAEMYKTLEEVL